ncbi:MAG: glycosyltransferase family 2 protein [Candidatus Woesearchaeota archaeon]
MAKKQIELTVLIPCYNEEESIKQCVMAVPDMPWSTEILVVDGGSKDDTFKVAKSIKKKGLRVIRYSPARTKGYACAFGLKHARGKVTVIQDVDMNPADIPQIVRPIFEGWADFVNGTRFILPMEPGAMSRLNKFGNKWIFSTLVSLVIRQKLTDSLCGYKAFHTSLLRGKLKEDNWPDFEMLIRAKRAGARIVEIPIRYVARKGGTPKMRPFRDGFSMLKMLIKLAVKR